MIDDAELRAESAEIEGLLEEAHALVPDPMWQRVEQLLGHVVRLYGAGLEHALVHARTAGAIDALLDASVIDDALLASLLALHGLHPLGTLERVERALAAVRAQLGLPAEALVLVALDGGVLHVEASDELVDRAATAICRVLEAAAPELSAIELERASLS